MPVANNSAPSYIRAGLVGELLGLAPLLLARRRAPRLALEPLRARGVWVFAAGYL